MKASEKLRKLAELMELIEQLPEEVLEDAAFDELKGEINGCTIAADQEAEEG